MSVVLSLSNAERTEIARGALLPAVDGATQLECVVVRADLFERFRYLFDDSPEAGNAELAAAIATVEPDDWKSPEEWRGQTP